MDLQALSAQFAGRKFGDLVLYHFKNMKQDSVMPALVGYIDAGQTFTVICNAAHKRLTDAGIPATADNVFALFQIILVNFVYGLHKQPQLKEFIQKSIGMGLLHRMLG